MSAHVMAAVDIGASGGRVMRGTIDDERVSLEAVHRFPNGVVEQDGHLRWNFTKLMREVDAGLERIPDAESVGIDTWGVDYGMVGSDGTLLTEPIAYRDDRSAKEVDGVHRTIPPDELFAINGLQFLPFTTIYQLAAEQRGPLWERAEHAVLLPDLVAHRLTGQLRTEVTNASTTGLLDVHTQTFSSVLFDQLSLPAGLLPPLQAPGERRGVTAAGIPVTTVGSHDTASAVVGVPATTPRFAYIASGTWSLVGLELPAPVVTSEVNVQNFTNELGVDGRTRFLRNVGGLWLLQECMRSWQRNDLATILDAAAQLPPGGPRIDADDPTFVPPGRMPERIAVAARSEDLRDPPAITRCILDSLADGYARALSDAARLANRSIDVVHVVGGGAQNELLCQLTADAVGLPVVAGPVEATALGNIVVQARALGMLPESLEEIRAWIAASTSLRRYEPR